MRRAELVEAFVEGRIETASDQEILRFLLTCGLGFDTLNPADTAGERRLLDQRIALGTKFQ